MKSIFVITILVSSLVLAGNAIAKHYGDIDERENLQPASPSAIFDVDTGFAYKERLEDLLIKLNDPDPFVRVEAIQSLGEIHKEQSLVAVCERLQDTNLYVRAYAAESLGKIGKLNISLALSRLLPALKDPSSYVRAMIVAALGELQDERAVAPLKELLHDEDDTVRGMAEWALGRIENSH